MEKSKFLTVVIIALLLLNFGTLGFLWTHRGGPPGGPGGNRPPDIFHFIVDELNMSWEQQKQYEVLCNEHHSKMLELQDQSRNLHDRFFGLAHASSSDSTAVKQMADSIAANQEQMDLLTFYHFQKVRALCTEEQQKKFDRIINEAMDQMGHRPSGR